MTTIPQGAVFSFDLPCKRPPLTANKRLHWAKKFPINRDLREAGWALAKQAHIPTGCRFVQVQLHYAPGHRRRIDPMNLTSTSKPVIDGLVDAGVVADDNYCFLKELAPEVHPPPEAGPRVWMTVQVM